MNPDESYGTALARFLGMLCERIDGVTGRLIGQPLTNAATDEIVFEGRDPVETETTRASMQLMAAVERLERKEEALDVACQKLLLAHWLHRNDVEHAKRAYDTATQLFFGSHGRTSAPAHARFKDILYAVLDGEFEFVVVYRLSKKVYSQKSSLTRAASDPDRQRLLLFKQGPSSPSRPPAWMNGLSHLDLDTEVTKDDITGSHKILELQSEDSNDEHIMAVVATRPGDSPGIDAAPWVIKERNDFSVLLRLPVKVVWGRFGPPTTLRVQSPQTMEGGAGASDGENKRRRLEAVQGDASGQP